MREFEEIVERNAPMVHRIATAYERQSDYVDDLIQEIWKAVWQALPRLRTESSTKSFVARIAQNICVTHVRRSVARRTEPLSDSLRDPALGHDDAISAAARVAGLIKAVQALPDNLKAVTTLYLEEIPIHEIALALGISQSNASVRLHRAKVAMKTALQELS